MVKTTSKIDGFKKALLAAVPSVKLVEEARELAHYGKDWLADFEARPSLILFPSSKLEIQTIIKLCNQHEVSVVPSGGRTGLSGGATATDGEIVLSLEKMRKIISHDAASRLLTCEAGVTTEEFQNKARELGLYFPVDFSSRGSSQIGGNIATNAGGMRVLKYGNIRDWVVGLKVVTGAGDLLELNGELIKNNSGYDFRSLIIGSEGTLGVIVEATLRLTSPSGDPLRVLCGAKSTGDVLKCLEILRQKFPNLSVFELMEQKAVDIVVKHKSLKNPFKSEHPYYVLFELERSNDEIKDGVVNLLGELVEKSLIADAVISESNAQAEELMALRDCISETLSTHYTIHKNDVAVPVSRIPDFVAELHKVIASEFDGFEVVLFGHVGDGNLHVNVLKDEKTEKEAFYRKCKEADNRIFEIVKKHRGTVSAEHGVGLLKKDFLSFTRSDVEIEMMRKIKKVFDPNGILNPGKVF